MGLLYVDNFHFWSVAPGTFQTIGSSSVSGNQLHNHGGALISNGLTSQATYNINFRANVISSNFAALWQLNGASSLGLICNFDGHLLFAKNFFTQIGPASTGAIVFDNQVTYYDFEAKVFQDAAGTVELRINGGSQIPSTTVNTGQTSANSCYIGATNSGSISLDQWVQHFIVMDGTGSAMNGNFIGPVNVEFLPPTGNGFYQDWSFTGAATAWEAIGSPPDGDTSYIFDNVVSDKSTFTHGTLSSGNTVVKGAAIWTYARRDDSTTRAFKNLLRLAGSDDLGSVEQFVGDDYIYFFQPYELSPFSGIAWTVSDINSVEYGVQLTT